MRVTPKVSGSHERANVLIDVATRGRLSAEGRQLYLAASNGLGNHDENRVLAALVRAEGTALDFSPSSPQSRSDGRLVNGAAE